ncbi:EmrB/QacA subfamily drug resistance transporter [Saccharothrix tamanrassetensis]|uniref:EmrB/QacA subfamily drug resistance transporter n=1 Tax=Saccharothrix tamanrassetensis TaxID=1051531 RepID=A0A841CPK2_9PSEU|nr:MFS transporter [Saccharothrix tamanrassetensis]MBB5959601.1 EmrB/QacA subfamily drug resistance transporter [Saccharothrix tamanrassetensis]
MLTALSLSVLLPSLSTSIANVGLPSMAVAFDAAFHEVQWVVIAYLLATTTLVVGVGRLGDLVGRRRLLLGGIAAFTLATLLCGLAPNLPLLVAGRALQGVGAACMMALTMAFVGETVTEDRTGRVMGLLGTMSAVGTALGPSLGGALIALFGWRAIFLVGVPLGLLALALTFRVLPDPAPAAGSARGRFDAVGMALLAVTLGAYALAMTVGGNSFGPLGVGLLIASAAGLVLFVLAESRAPSPLVALPMFRHRVLTAGLTTSALVSTVVMTTLVVGPFHLARALDLAPASVGLAMSVGPAVSALAGVPAGRATDRFGAHAMVVVGLGGIICGAAVLSLMPTSAGVLGYVLPLVVVTAGYALFQAANNTAVMVDVSPQRRGLVSGMVNLSRNLGLMTGASVMGAVFAFTAGTSDVTTAASAEVARGTRSTFAVAALLVTFGLVVVLWPRLRARPSPGHSDGPVARSRR